MGAHGGKMTISDDQDIIKNAGEIIERFGGIRPMAGKMNVPVTTVQGWKKRDAIPLNRYQDILSAARAHQIDLSDVMTLTAPANQNKIEDTALPASDEPRVIHVRSSSPSYNRDEYKTHAELMAQIKSGNEQAVKASVWITTGLILLALGGVGFLMWPAAQKVERQESQIAALTQDVKDTNLRASFFKNLMPEDMEQKLNEMQNQARNLQATVTEISQNAEDLKQTLLSSDSGPLAERLAKLETQVVALTGSAELGDIISRVRTLEQTVQGQGQLGDAIKEIQGIVDSMDGRVNDVEQKLGQAQSDQTALGQTIEGVSPDDIKAAAMLVVFSQLRDSVNRQVPFSDDLVLLQKLAGEDNPELQSALTRLAPQAEGGVLTSQGLSREFKTLAGDIAFASLKGEDISVMDQVKTRFSSMLSVQKDGQPVGGTDEQKTVQKAQQMLDAGDVQGAIAELQTLEGASADAAAPFIAKAQQTVLTEDVQAMIYETILAKLGSVSPQLSSEVQKVMPTPATGNTAPGTAPVEPVLPQIDLNSLKQGAQDMIPGLSAGDMVKDEESGLAITPPAQKFKGFSAGQ